MVRRLKQLLLLLSTRARIGLAVTAVLLVVERLVLAIAAFGLAGRLQNVWVASVGVAFLWALRGLVRQAVVREARETLTMIIARGALERGGDGSFLPGEEADAAVFEGRNAAEQTIVRHAPPLVAEPVAAIILFLAIKPAGVPILVCGAAVVIVAVLVAALRSRNLLRQRGAWRQYIDVARDTLTSVRAAPELIASGYERTYLERLKGSVQSWTETAARAERSAALFQRIPFAALVIIGVVLVTQTQSLDLASIIRLGVFFPPLAGVIRAAYDIMRTAPRILTLAAALDATQSELSKHSAGARRSPPEMPCEIRFEKVGFSYGDVAVLKDVSFVWKPGQLLGIKGPNGSGKSTLLRLMLGLLEPTAGRILVDGVDLREIDLPAWRRGIAYLPQRPYVPEKATVIEAMRITAPELQEDQARSALARVNAGDASNRGDRSGVDRLDIPMSVLSVGARQRVHLARVFGQLRPVALLDEPDENLDSAARTVFLELVSRTPRGESIAIVSHQDGLLVSANEVVCLE